IQERFGSMNLELCCGYREFFSAKACELDHLAEVWPRPVIVPKARWLSSRCGKFSHDFLRDGNDIRVEVFGQSLAETIGRGKSALILLPDIVSRDAASASGSDI